MRSRFHTALLKSHRRICVKKKEKKMCEWGGFSWLGRRPPRGLVVRCVFVQDKTSPRAHILMFHCFIYYVNSSTEYFSNWPGHERLPTPHPSPPHVSLLAQRRRLGQLAGGEFTFFFGRRQIIFISNLSRDTGHMQRRGRGGWGGRGGRGSSTKCLVGNDWLPNI